MLYLDLFTCPSTFLESNFERSSSFSLVATLIFLFILLSKLYAHLVGCHVSLFVHSDNSHGNPLESAGKCTHLCPVAHCIYSRLSLSPLSVLEGGASLLSDLFLFSESQMSKPNFPHPPSSGSGRP